MLLESPGFFGVQFPGPGKSWKMGLVLGSPGNLSARSWKVVEFSRLWWCGRWTKWRRCRFACSHISTDCSVKQILVTAHLYCI